MKKRFLSLLMAFCLMLSLAPAAFAADRQPDTITLPNGEVREIPTLEADAASYALADTQSTQQTIYIKDEVAFDKVTDAEWRGNNKFIVTGDIHLENSTKTVAEWGGFIQYFCGELIGKKEDGTTPVISGIPNNCALIYGIIGGKIENLVFNHGSNAAFITFMPVNSSSTPNSLEMTDVTVKGTISLTGSDQSNYAPFLYCAPQGGLTMTRCHNDATITGSIYGSVFHGYYPLFVGPSTPYKFIDCTNKKDVTMQYAGMFFGNSSSVEGKVGADNLYLTITDCKNNATIRGTSGAKYFAAPVAEFGSNMQAVEKVLNPTDPEAVQAASHINVSQITGSGKICTGNPLTGFGATLSGDTITVTRPSNEAKVDHYTVSVSAYVNLWYPALGESGEFFGTNRFTVSQTIKVSEMGSSNTFTPELKAYGFADYNFSGTGDIVAGHATLSKDGKSYYVVDFDYSEDFEQYVSTNLNEDGVPAADGAKAADIISVSAYDADGNLIDSKIL